MKSAKKTLRHRSLSLVLTVSLVLGLGGIGAAGAPGDEVIATLDGKPITLAEIEENAAFQIYRLRGSIHSRQREAGRQYTRGRIIGFNAILKRVTEQYNAEDANHHYAFTDAIYKYPFVESRVFDIDCFHPSAPGQKELSRVTWINGPFKIYNK